MDAIEKKKLLKGACIPLLLLFGYNILVPVTTSIASSLPVFASQSEDRFTIAVLATWNTRVMPSSGGKTYMFWDGAGNALSVKVMAPNSFEQLLSSIAENKVSKSDLAQIQKEFQGLAPHKIDLSLDISTVSSRKTLTQSYLYRQETLDTVSFMKNISHDFLYLGRQYSISYSSPPAPTKESAKAKFEKSFQTYFKPMLISFFVH
jgi:hypothetical protein